MAAAAHRRGRDRRWVTPGRQERARRKCIERLLSELASRGIARVVFERRYKDLDAHDRTMITALQRQQSLPAVLRASWEPGGRRAPTVVCRHRGATEIG